MPTRKQDAKTANKFIVHLDCLLVGLAQIASKNVSSLLTKINREHCQHEIELASSKKRESSVFVSRTFTVDSQGLSVLQ